MTEKLPRGALQLFTIGHSNYPLADFIGLLSRHHIEIVVDVRSSPHSGYAPHFNKDAIEPSLDAHGIRYLFLGNMLGGQPPSEDFYDDEGRVLYGELEQAPGFQEGIANLLNVIQSHRAALLCGEEDPANCHRRLLIGRVLGGRGVDVVHIRGDGRLQTEDELAQEEEFQRTKGQLSLFDTEETQAWRSTRSVSQKRTPPTSSGRSSGPGSSV